MSNTLAIAAATTTLRNLLHTHMPDRDSDLGEVEFTTQPPDLARNGITKPQLNLFLYQTGINAGWRNRDMPGLVRPGETAAPPLPLNLYYLITAYGRGENDINAFSHRVLGGAMSVLHDHAVLARSEIAASLAGNDLAVQFESLRITFQPLSLEDMSKLWTTFQTQYRISAAYEVTVVLIDSHMLVKVVLFVIKRGDADRGPTATAAMAPVLESVVMPRSQPAVRLGEDFILRGKQLAVADTKIRFTTPRLPAPIELDPLPSADGALAIHLPNKTNDSGVFAHWAPGFYSIGLVERRAGQPTIVSNELPFALAPQIGVAPKTASKGDTITVTCAPRIVTGQRVLVLFGDSQVEPVKVTSPPSAGQPTKVTFKVPAVAAGDYVVRLRVDGVDSLPVSYAGTVPAFDPAQKVTVS